jgi:Bacterial SH3 domain
LLSPQPTINRTVSEPPARPLAYEQKIARTAQPPAVADADQPQQHAMAPADANPTETAPDQDAPGAAPADEAPASDHDMAALPPDDGAGANNPDALPWQHAGPPAHRGAPGMGADAGDPSGEGQYDDPDPMAAVPGDDADPNVWPEDPQQQAQEWVQVLVSGTGMRGTPSDDSPLLFAFPYGRTLRVVSRYEGWVEVTDPQSAATGWMKAQYLAPIAAPGTPQESEALYDDNEPRWRRSWLRRHGGGLGDLIGRALGGGF